MFTEVQKEVTNKVESIRMCGKKANEELKAALRERGLDDDAWFSYDFTDKHLEVVKEVWDRWHTTNNFKVGDKVYVVPLTSTIMKNCIRATVTEITTDGWGYHLRAFESDLPGIYMFNIWDKDLEPRKDKSAKPVPPELRIK